MRRKNVAVTIRDMSALSMFGYNFSEKFKAVFMRKCCLRSQSSVNKINRIEIMEQSCILACIFKDETAFKRLEVAVLIA